MSRQDIEKQIAKSAVEALIAAGYVLTVDDGEDQPIKRSGSVEDVMKAMFQVDEERILAQKDGERSGWIFFVYGNDGWDVINDFSVNLEEVLKPTGELARELSNQ